MSIIKKNNPPMPILKRQKGTHAAGIMILFCLLVFSFAGCGKSDSDQASIIIYNACGKALDLFIDGNFLIVIAYEEKNTIENITPGVHRLEAYVAGTNMQVRSFEAELKAGGEYEWTIHGPSSIAVTNAYGETLQILMDGADYGDFEDSVTYTIYQVRFGDHLLEAVKKSDDTLASSITIEVDEVKEYSWIITK